MPWARPGYGTSVTATLDDAHEHVWQLHAVHHEDGADVQELGCTCGAINFR